MRRIKVRSKLGDYLKARGLPKNWLAEQLVCDKSQVNRWCNNKNGEAIGTPSVAYLLMILKILGCRLEDIYEEIPDESE
ncbi:helix-turn-helix domain-containing protein [Bacillus infantis]|uniref:helix-turn-helix domain-containing protein n=1 Tax=Bacillus infantis TaxID=324767 RepID=UPI003CE70C36